MRRRVMELFLVQHGEARTETEDPERAVVRFRNGGIVCLLREQDTWSVGWSVIPDIL